MNLPWIRLKERSAFAEILEGRARRKGLESALRVLVIEDDPLDYRILNDGLAEVPNSGVELVRVTRLSGGIARARNEPFDAVLLDLNLPDSSGIETIDAALRELPDLPIVVMTRAADDDTALEALRRGAQDFLVKSRLGSVGELTLRSLRYAIERHRMLIALENERSRREAHKDEFLSHVSHELRTPLSAIQQFGSILLANIAGPLSTDQREYVATIQRNTKQLGRMINDILEVTRSDEGVLRLRLRRVEVAPVVDEVVKTFAAEAEERGVALWFDRQEDLPPVHADPGRLRQILLNLVANALEFTPAGGSICVAANGRPEDECVQIHVRDSGCGIKPGAQQRIFERMVQEANPEQRSRKGLGLGLHICRDLVHRQGGQIWVESKLGEGSTFFFTLRAFNLSRLLFPKATSGGELRASFALVVVRLDSTQKSLWDARTLDAVRNILERSIYPDRDVVVADLNDRESLGILFILASADEAGADAMCVRLRQAIQEGSEVANLEHLSVDWSPIEGAQEDPPLDRNALKLAHRVELMIKREEEIDG